MNVHTIKTLVPVAAALLLSACSGSGHLTLVPQPAKSIKSKGSPFVSLNQGGRAVIVEQGKTASTGVHGWVAVQSVSGRTLSDGAGSNAVILNAPAAPNGGRGLSSQ